MTLDQAERHLDEIARLDRHAAHLTSLINSAPDREGAAELFRFAADARAQAREIALRIKIDPIASPSLDMTK